MGLSVGCSQEAHVYQHSPNLEVKQCHALETVDLDRLLVSDFLLEEEGLDGFALIALELQHLLPRFLVLEHSAVAAMLLLDRLLDLLQVQLRRETRHSRDTLTAVTLLDADMHLALIKS
jgi:hypothetical protein